jgi:hypothetical protein
MKVWLPWAGRVAEMIQLLPNKHETLSSNQTLVPEKEKQNKTVEKVWLKLANQIPAMFS